jgi:putative ABC transport system permease protein
MYFPHAQAGRSAYYTPSEMTLVIRTTGDPRALVTPVRAAISRLDASVALSRVETMDDVIAASVASRRFSTQLLALFAGLALALSAIGIYGVISYGVNERRFELGLRMALGAQRGDVLGLVLREGIALAGVGTAVGVAGAWALVKISVALRLIPAPDTLLVRTSLADPATIIAVIALLLAVTVLASWVPARRATRLDPGATLRDG